MHGRVAVDGSTLQLRGPVLPHASHPGRAKGQIVASRKLRGISESMKQEPGAGGVATSTAAPKESNQRLLELPMSSGIRLRRPQDPGMTPESHIGKVRMSVPAPRRELAGKRKAQSRDRRHDDARAFPPPPAPAQLFKMPNRGRGTASLGGREFAAIGPEKEVLPSQTNTTACGCPARNVRIVAMAANRLSHGSRNGVEGGMSTVIHEPMAPVPTATHGPVQEKFGPGFGEWWPVELVRREVALSVEGAQYI